MFLSKANKTWCFFFLQKVASAVATVWTRLPLRHHHHRPKEGELAQQTYIEQSFGSVDSAIRSEGHLFESLLSKSLYQGISPPDPLNQPLGKGLNTGYPRPLLFIFIISSLTSD